MQQFQIPYGRKTLTANFPDHLQVDQVTLQPIAAAADPIAEVSQALAAPLGGVTLEKFSGAKSVAIAINDKTRPVPHHHLLPPLLERLKAVGIKRESITLIIASGTHPPMTPDEFSSVLPTPLVERYRVVSHNCDDETSLIDLGKTDLGTPLIVNKIFSQADVRMALGNIEPHQFAGFSGGVKSAAIGLMSRATINSHHALMLHPDSQLGRYDGNPARMEVEEIGKRLGVHFALNAILNDHKEIVRVLAGDPLEVMRVGVPLSRKICQVSVKSPYDLVVASPGGHPKDINIYQSQKGFAHATMITRKGGTVIVTAACPEGSGSSGYENWAKQVSSYHEVFERFKQEGFRVGPHKAYQIARDASRVNLLWLSDMDFDFAKKLLLNPVISLDEAIAKALSDLPSNAHIAMMPIANATIPVLRTQ